MPKPISKTKVKHKVSWWHKRLDDKQRVWFREVYRDSGCCICGGQNIQVSHIYPKGTYRGLRYDPMNIVPHCGYHHMFFWHANPLEAHKWFREKFPDRYTYLQEASKVFIKVNEGFFQKVDKAMDERDTKSLLTLDI